MTRFIARAFTILTLPVTAIAIAFAAPLQSSNDFSDKMEKRLSALRGQVA